jgi:hypothetical protein
LEVQGSTVLLSDNGSSQGQPLAEQGREPVVVAVVELDKLAAAAAAAVGEHASDQR